VLAKDLSQLSPVRGEMRTLTEKDFLSVEIVKDGKPR
jgi:hypothetical protein